MALGLLIFLVAVVLAVAAKKSPKQVLLWALGGAVWTAQTFVDHLEPSFMASEEIFMSGKRYTDELKIEAVRQVTEHERRVVEVAQRLDIGRIQPVVATPEC